MALKIPRVALLILLAAAPLAAQQRWRLTEVARIGGSDEGLASFNDIRDLQLDEKGQVWVLDFQAKSLRLFGADGKAIKEVARPGRGPGEIVNSNGIRRAADGRVFLRDHSNKRISIYDASGAYVRDHAFSSASYSWRVDAAIDRQGRYLERTSARNGDGLRDVILRLGADFARVDTVDAPPAAACTALPLPPDGIRARRGFHAIPFAPRILQTLAPSGATWCVNTDDYRIRRIPLGGKAHDLELRAVSQRIRIPPAQRDSALAEVDSFLVLTGGAETPWNRASVPRDRGPIIGIVADDRDRIWVLRESPAGPTELDVWDASGRRLATLAPGFNAGAFPLLRITGDRLAVVVLDEDELPTIHVYRIDTR